MHIEKTRLSGCYRIAPARSTDERGAFFKIYHELKFKEWGLETQFRETYYTASKQNVLRGLHFQVPPMQHVKLVACIAGSVVDVVLDIRRGSPTYGEHEMFEMDSERGDMIYVPRGFAHGFYVKSQSALMLYMVSEVHAPTCDAGILWNSARITWPCTSPIVSSRDSTFSAFTEFVTPFDYE